MKSVKVTMSRDFTGRFTGRAAIYAKHRPAYPSQILDILRAETGFHESKTIADIGSGTGLLSGLFLQNGNKVFGVEPNDEMRSFAEQDLSIFPNFVSVRGRAEYTTLEDVSVDLVVVGQALHWFDQQLAKKEFVRILRTNRDACIIYNDRNKNDPFMQEYDTLVRRHARDRARVPDINDAYLSSWFRNGKFKKFTLRNEQVLDFEGLMGRIMSASYMPSASDSARFSELKEDLSHLFGSSEKEGKVTLLYDTDLFLGVI